jgi:hypothetical protein
MRAQDTPAALAGASALREPYWDRNPLSKGASVWAGFDVLVRKGDTGDIEVASYEKAKCLLCNTEFSWGGPNAKSSASTSPLLKHLRTTHPNSDLMRAIEIVDTGRLPGDSGRQITLAQSFSSITRTIEYPLASPQHRALEHALLLYLACDNLALSHVESAEFQAFVKALDPRFHMPGRTTITDRVLPQVFKVIQELVLCRRCCFLFRCRRCS